MCFAVATCQFVNIYSPEPGLGEQNVQPEWLRTDVDMKTERTCTWVGHSVHEYCDY